VVGTSVVDLDPDPDPIESVCFWSSRIRIPQVHPQAKKVRKTLFSPLKENLFFVGILSATEEKAESGSRAGSVSQVSGTDPLIRIRNKMSRIHNTGRIILYLISCFSKFVSII
jgi:hypothetical protein